MSITEAPAALQPFVLDEDLLRRTLAAYQTFALAGDEAAAGRAAQALEALGREPDVGPYSGGVFDSVFSLASELVQTVLVPEDEIGVNIPLAVADGWYLSIDFTVDAGGSPDGYTIVAGTPDGERLTRFEDDLPKAGGGDFVRWLVEFVSIANTMAVGYDRKTRALAGLEALYERCHLDEGRDVSFMATDERLDALYGLLGELGLRVP